jgi:isoleucyl-tRNA synthetase
MKNSVHLTNIPNLDFIDDNLALISEIDLIKEICSVALAIRDNANIKVRTPLKRIFIIGKKGEIIKNYEEIIKEEVNVKEIDYIANISDEAQNIVDINFKLVAKKFSAKMKEIIKCSKIGEWNVENNRLNIAEVFLEKNEFEVKLKPKDAQTSLPISTNDILIKLDITLNQELIEEGHSRDISRMIQQSRKDSSLDISQKINLILFNKNSEIDLEKIIHKYQQYLQDQTLSNNIKISQEENINAEFIIEQKIDKIHLKIGILPLL